MEVSTRISEPELSFVMPCYNEQDIIGYTIPRFTAAFKKAGIRLELIAIDNGSRDRTGEMIREMAANDPAIVYHRVEVNEGYGNGVLSGIKVCRAPWLGIIPCDGQVDAEDVVALFDTVKTTNGNVLAKVRRRFRMDGLWRKVVSVSYNLMVRALWPRLGSIDVNGSPKILPRDAINAMDLKSKTWFLDPEIVIKAHYMGLRVLEFNVFARMRGNGLSHVRVTTCWEFLRNLLVFRFSPEMPKWRRNLNLESKTDKAQTAAISH